MHPGVGRADSDLLKLVGSKRPSAEVLVGILPRDRSKLKCISWYVVIQCVVVFIAAATVLECMLKPDDGFFELDTLARIMYLYDTNSCGITVSLRQFKDFFLDNETYGLAIRPIRHEPVFINVLTKLSGKTRTYIKVSVFLHVVWLGSALILRVFLLVRDVNVFKIILRVFLYITSMLILFDFCVGIVYMSHIQQALTKAMIIRYSGWGMVPAKVRNPEEFGGWVPLIAAGVWLRGGVFLVVNMYMCRFVRRVIHKIRGKEVRSRISTVYNVPFPDANFDQKINHSSLYFRAGNYNKF